MSKVITHAVLEFKLGFLDRNCRMNTFYLLLLVCICVLCVMIVLSLKVYVHSILLYLGCFVSLACPVRLTVHCRIWLSFYERIKWWWRRRRRYSSTGGELLKLFLFFSLPFCLKFYVKKYERTYGVYTGWYLPEGRVGNVLVTEFRGIARNCLFCADVLRPHDRVPPHWLYLQIPPGYTPAPWESSTCGQGRSNFNRRVAVLFAVESENSTKSLYWAIGLSGSQTYRQSPHYPSTASAVEDNNDRRSVFRDIWASYQMQL